jgi:NRPS condensation-like uncharacterized protein
MTKDDKLRLLCHFQHWLGTHYNNLPTDSGNMTERSRKFLKDNEQAFSLFNVVEQSEQLNCQCKKAKFTRTVDADFNPLCGRCGKAL